MCQRKNERRVFISRGVPEYSLSVEKEVLLLRNGVSEDERKRRLFRAGVERLSPKIECAEEEKDDEDGRSDGWPHRRLFFGLSIDVRDRRHTPNGTTRSQRQAMMKCEQLAGEISEQDQCRPLFSDGTVEAHRLHRVDVHEFGCDIFALFQFLCPLIVLIRNEVVEIPFNRRSANGFVKKRQISRFDARFLARFLDSGETCSLSDIATGIECGRVLMERIEHLAARKSIVVTALLVTELATYENGLFALNDKSDAGGATRELKRPRFAILFEFLFDRLDYLPPIGGLFHGFSLRVSVCTLSRTAPCTHGLSSSLPPCRKSPRPCMCRPS